MKEILIILCMLVIFASLVERMIGNRKASLRILVDSNRVYVSGEWVTATLEVVANKTIQATEVRVEMIANTSQKGFVYQHMERLLEEQTFQAGIPFRKDFSLRIPYWTDLPVDDNKDPRLDKIQYQHVHRRCSWVLRAYLNLPGADRSTWQAFKARMLYNNE